MHRTTFLLLPFLAAIAFGSIPVSVDSLTPHARSYQYSFLNGNLVANWSFESDAYFWNSTRESQVVRCGKACQPVTGSYAMEVIDYGDLEKEGISEPIPVEGGQSYTLSLFSHAEEVNGEHPEIWFYSDNSTVIQKSAGHAYTKDGRWILHKDSFTAPAAARFAKVVLYVGIGTSATLHFDDVIFEKGASASDRSTVGMSISYVDGLGRGYQRQTLLSREWASELVPSECMNGFLVHGNSLSRVGSRAKVSGGNIGSDDSLFIDNDVTLPSPSGSYTLLRADGGMRLGDRVLVTGDAEYGHALSAGSQSSISGMSKQVAGSSCPVQTREFSVGSSDVYVNNDADSALVPGSYKDAMFRARSNVYLRAGDYYFKTFHLEPQAVLHFDLSEGNVRIFVSDELRIDDNTTFAYEESGSYFIGWYTGQTSTLRLGTISNLSGVFVAPVARLELGHQSTLKGTMYANEVYVMENATLTAPAFLFHDPKMVMAVAGTSYDWQGRMSKGELAFPAEMSSEGFAELTLGHAKDFYSATGDGADAKGYPYSEPLYSAQDGRVLEQGSPGSDWRVGGGHSASGDKFFVNSLEIPSSLVGGGPVTTNYSLAWSKDAQGSYSLSWTDLLGRTVQTASSIGGSGNDLAKWQWSVSRYEYTPEGRLLRTLTPLDVASGNGKFSVVASYDAAGRVVAKNGPDRGLEKFWYAVDGTPRLTQTEEQRKRNAYTYVNYDAQGRKISSGETILTGKADSDLWAMSESPAAITGVRTEYSGIAYDAIESCKDAIGISGLSKWLDTLTLENTRGLRACAWSRNPVAVGALSAIRALVVDFYSYDRRGRLIRTSRYTGSVSDEDQRLRSLEYSYDSSDRMSLVAYRDGRGTLLSRSEYHYDEKGRVSSISDMEGRNVVSFGYSEMGKLVHATLGADVRIDYEYHLHGQVKSIRALRISTETLLYSQSLGYEEKVAPGSAEPRYDGLIAQNLVDFAKDVAQTPERLAEYDYDRLGRLVQRSGTDSRFAMDYDLNGRIVKQDNGSESLAYAYGDASYRLDHVNGSTPLAPGRDMSMDGNFQWDADGRMVYDASRDLLIDYDATGLPSEFRRLDFSDSLGERGFAQTQLYGPDGMRTSTFNWIDSAGSRRLVGARTDVVLGGRKQSELWEAFDMDSTNVVAVTEYTMIQGRSGIVGRVRPDGLAEWYVQDYQGSLVLTVVGNGYGSAFAYHPYGSQILLRADGQPPSEQYTGKEWDGQYEFYYYGARFLDPVLGMWVVPDPAGQYFNPYGVGGDLVNYTDADGRWLISAFKQATGVGAITNIVSAAQSAMSQNSLKSALWSGAIDLTVNSTLDEFSPAVAATGVAWGSASSAFAFGRAITGNGSWGDVMKPLAVSVWAPFMSDINTLNNSGAAINRGEFGEAFTNFGASGTNSTATSWMGMQYSANKGFGSQRYKYYGSYEGSGGHRNLIWGQSTNNMGSTSAENFGQNIRLFKGYYGKNDADKKRLLIHEFVHARQQSKYGTGGAIVRKEFLGIGDPSGKADCGEFGFTCAEVKQAYEDYPPTDPFFYPSGTLDLMELEAELHENAGKNSEYYFDADVFN